MGRATRLGVGLGGVGLLEYVVRARIVVGTPALPKLLSLPYTPAVPRTRTRASLCAGFARVCGPAVDAPAGGLFIHSFIHVAFSLASSELYV